MNNSVNLKILLEKFMREAINVNYELYPENVVAENIGNKPWIKLDISIITSRPLALNFPDKIGTGFVRFEIYIAIDTGSKLSYEISDQIANAISDQDVLNSDDGCTTIEFHEGLTQTPAIKENNYFKQTLSLSFRFYRSN